MTTVSMGELQAELPSYVNKVHDDHDEVFVTDGGIPKAVLVDADEYLATQATMDLLGSPGLLDQVDRGLDDPREFSMEELLEAMDTGVMPEPWNPGEPVATAVIHEPQNYYDPFAEKLDVPFALLDSSGKRPLSLAENSELARLREHLDERATFPAVEQLIHRRRLDDALSKLNSHLGETPWPRPSSVLSYLQIRQQLAEGFVRPIDALAKRNLYDYLRAEARHYPGRDRDVNRLVVALSGSDTGDFAASVLTALGGVGKTHLTSLLVRAISRDHRPRRSARSAVFSELLEYVEFRRPDLLEHLRDLGTEQRVAVYEIIIDGLAGLVDVETFADATLLQPPLVTPKTDDEPKLVVVRKAA